MKENETRNISQWHPVDGFKCEKCGIDLRDWSRIEFDEDDDYSEFVREYEFKFCPHCGRKIVEEETMTKRDADFIGAMNMCDEISNEAYKKIMCHCEEQQPCEDAISREVAIRWVKTECNPYGKPTLDFESGKKVIEHLKQMPSVTPKQKWIPVSEKLPKAEYGESDNVWVCFEDETQGILYFDGGNWCYPTGETYVSVNHKTGWHNKVIAWMPLPEPYKAEGEGE